MHLLPLLFLLPTAAQAETVRSVLAEKPLELLDLQTVAKVCTEVSKRSPVDPEDDSAEADLEQERWEAGRKVTFARVYRAVVDPKSVRFEPYDMQDGELPVAVDRTLPALDGALLLSVMDREGAAFAMTADEAKRLVERAEQKQLRLAIELQIDHQKAEEMSPCWSYPKSETWSLRVLPLRYELIDPAGKTLAASSTERAEELGEYLGKKARETEVSTAVVEGVVDQAALEKAITEKRGAIDACVAKAGETASFGLVADVAGGKLGEVRIEMEASDDPAAGSCLVAALTGTAAPKASKDAAVSVVVSVD